MGLALQVSRKSLHWRPGARLPSGWWLDLLQSAAAAAVAAEPCSNSVWHAQHVQHR
jgi:hypothetical protein